MRDQPNDRDYERDDEHQENDPPFAALLAQGAARPRFVREGVGMSIERDIEPRPFRAGELPQVFPASSIFFLGHARRFRDHALEFFHLPAQLRFLAREFYLGLIEGRV